MTLYEQRLTEDLQTIRHKVQDISDRVCEAMEAAVRAVADGDRDALNDVVLNDYAINRDIRCIDKRCHEFVARHLPAAGHLRFISAVLRITIALERAGDYAVTISRVVLQLTHPMPERLTNRIQSMSKISVTMLSDATVAFLSGNEELATETKKLDYRVDKAYDEIFSVLMEEGKAFEPQKLVSLLKIFSKVERFSDQAKNICEEAVFIATGKMKKTRGFKVLFVDERNDLASQVAVALARKGFPNSGNFASAGWAPADEVDPDLHALAERFGFDTQRARPAQVGELDTFPIAYHLVVAINLPDESVLPTIPYHTILRRWDVPIPEGDKGDLVRDLSSRIQQLMVKLHGRNGE